MKNFWKLGDFSFWADTYMYIDHSSYLADSLFEQRGIGLRRKGEMIRKDKPYHVIFCKVRKRDKIKFEEALDRLPDKMLLLGHREYQEVCEEMEHMIEIRLHEQQVRQV